MKIVMVRRHNVPVAVLRQNAEARLAEYTAKYPNLELPTRFHWVSERVAAGSYRGGKGTLTLADDAVTLEMELPFFARPFRSRIEAFVDREFDAAIPPG